MSLNLTEVPIQATAAVDEKLTDAIVGGVNAGLVKKDALAPVSAF